MNCSEFRSSLDNYVLLDDRELADIEGHAQMCDACRSELEFYKSIIQTTASIPVPDPPADFIAKVNARIDSEPKLNRTVNNIIWGVRNNARRYAALAACLVVGLAVGLNRDVIKNGLSGGGGDGIISERTVSETQAPDSESPDVSVEDAEGTDVEKKPEQNEASEQKLPESEPKEQPEKKAVSVSAENKLIQRAKETTVPKVSSEATAKKPVSSSLAVTNTPTETEGVISPEAEAKATAKAAEVNIVTEAPVISNRTAAPAATEKSIGKYTIARANYYILEEETAIAEAATDEPSAEEYEIKKAGYQIAQGDYSGNVKEAGGVSSVSISDKIIVNAADADAVAAVISSLGIPSTNGFYTTVSATFYELLSRLDAEGLEYSYSLQYSSGDKVVFKLVMR